MIVVAWTVCLFQIIVGVALWYAARTIGLRLGKKGAAPRSQSLPRLVIAATGELPGLERLRDALAAQDTPIGRLIFSVEATADPAFDRISAVFASFPAPVTIVTAGLATIGGQKSLNLVAALRTLDDEAPIVFADADILPHANWLATLLRPIDLGKADIVTGYRWPVPLDGRLPTLIVTWIDRAVAALPRLIGAGLIWGGSTALAAGVCTRIGLADRLDRQISDDLFLTILARERRLRVAFTAAALLATPTRHDWASMFRFGRRQYQMIRMYAPAAFLASLAVTSLALIASLTPLMLATTTWWALPAYAAMTTVAMLLARARGRLVKTADDGGGRLAERRVVWLAAAVPLVHVVHLAMILAAIRVRSVPWGHCIYAMDGRSVVSVDRRPYDRA